MSDSVRSKIIYQANKAIETEQILMSHLKSIESLGALESQEVADAFPIIIECFDMVYKMLADFKTLL